MRAHPRSVATDRPALGISACLLGENVRYNGEIRRDPWIVGTLSRYVRLVPLCPEMAIGMGMPRPPIRLVERTDGVHAEGETVRNLDVTDALRGYGARMVEEVTEISGYVFKARSPSCGVESVNLFRPGDEAPRLEGTGLYAAEWKARRPELPLEEEGNLGDPARRDSFFERVFTLLRWQRMMARGATAERVLRFHTAHRLHALSRSERVARGLDARAERGEAEAYLRAFMEALRTPATRAGHGRVFASVAKAVRGLSRLDQTEMNAALEDYRLGRVPRLVPVTLLGHHLRRGGIEEFAESAYLHPSASEWALRAD